MKGSDSLNTSHSFALSPWLSQGIRGPAPSLLPLGHVGLQKPSPEVSRRRQDGEEAAQPSYGRSSLQS